MPLLSRNRKPKKNNLQLPKADKTTLSVVEDWDVYKTPTRPDDEEAWKPTESASFEVRNPKSEESTADDDIFKGLFNQIKNNKQSKKEFEESKLPSQLYRGLFNEEEQKYSQQSNDQKSDDKSQSQTTNDALPEAINAPKQSKNKTKSKKASETGAIPKKAKKQHKPAKERTRSDSSIFASPADLKKPKKRNAKSTTATKKIKKPKVVKLDETLDSDTSGFASQEILNDYIEFLSQTVRPLTPMPEKLSQPEQIAWLQEKRNVGLYVQCDQCNKFRYLKDTKDPLELPRLWFCHMNKDKSYNKCSIPEEPIPMAVEEELIFNEYNAGSIVYARLDGFPWWPAMIDDDPDYLCYFWLEGLSDRPTQYCVTFFDAKEVTRAWLRPQNIVSFQAVESGTVTIKKPSKAEERLYGKRLAAAKEQAHHALDLELLERLRQYCFQARWTKGIGNLKEEEDQKAKKPSKKRSEVAKKKQGDGEKKQLKSKKKAETSSKDKAKQTLKRKSSFRLDKFLERDSSVSTLNEDLQLDKGWGGVSTPGDVSPLSFISDIIDSLG